MGISLQPKAKGENFSPCREVNDPFYVDYTQGHAVPQRATVGQLRLAQALLRGDLRVRYLIFIHVFSSILWQLKRQFVFSKLFGSGGLSGRGPGGRRECED
jgi:hypothetical protein